MITGKLGFEHLWSVLGLKDEFLLKSSEKYYRCDHFGKITETRLKIKSTNQFLTRKMAGFAYDSFFNKYFILPPYAMGDNELCLVDEDGFVQNQPEHHDIVRDIRFTQYNEFYRTKDLICFSKLNRRQANFISKDKIDLIISSSCNFFIVDLRNMSIISYDLPITPLNMGITQNEMTVFVSDRTEFIIFDLDR